MIKTNIRYKNNQSYVRDRYNQQANTTKKINKTLNQRGGIKL